MQKKALSILLPILAVSISACHSGQDAVASSFKDTPVCQSQLQDMVDHNFKLGDIPKQELKFVVTAKDAQAEIVQINYIEPPKNEVVSIGRIKVDKAAQQLHNSTFDDMNLIPIKVDSAADFINQCF